MLVVNYLYDLRWKVDNIILNNRHEDDLFTKERLDRVVANLQLFELYRDYTVEVLIARILYYVQASSTLFKEKHYFDTSLFFTFLLFTFLLNNDKGSDY